MALSRTITAADARHVLARVHGFEPSGLTEGKDGTKAVFIRHQCVQSDPIEVAGRNADLTLHSRVANYRPQFLIDLLYDERRLFEYFCKMLSIMPVELYPIFKHKMKAFAKQKRIVSFFKNYRKETTLVLNALEKGPVSPRDLNDMGKMEWGWGHRANLSNIILSRLWVSGRAMIYDRNGAAKYYALPEKVIPKKILHADPPRKGEDLMEIAKTIVKASRLVMPGDSPEQWFEVGKTKNVREILQELERRGDLFSVQLEGSKDKFYAPVEDFAEWENPEPPKDTYVRFLAPLDPLLWSRRVFRMIYGREYIWEVYKRPKDRKYGYYCLPVIFNGDYAGLIEPFLRKKDRVLEIRNFHILDTNIVRNRFLVALSREMKRFCGYMTAERTEVKRSPRWASEALEIVM